MWFIISSKLLCTIVHKRLDLLSLKEEKKPDQDPNNTNDSNNAGKRNKSFTNLTNILQILKCILFEINPNKLCLTSFVYCCDFIASPLNPPSPATDPNPNPDADNNTKIGKINYHEHFWTETALFLS